MGHYCRFCARNLRKDRFSAEGYRDHVCRDCEETIPREDRQAMDAFTEISGFLHGQDRISPKDVERLTELLTSKAKGVAEQAGVMLEVARVAPDERGRVEGIRTCRPDLWRRLIEVGLMYPTNREEGVWAALGAGLASDQLDLDEDDDEP